MTTLCQMEILNFLWLNWDQYLPLAPTRIDIPPSHPQGGVQIYPRANLLSKTMNLKVIIPNSDFDFLDICGEEKHVKQCGTRTRTVGDDLGELW